MNQEIVSNSSSSVRNSGRLTRCREIFSKKLNSLHTRFFRPRKEIPRADRRRHSVARPMRSARHVRPACQPFLSRVARISRKEGNPTRWYFSSFIGMRHTPYQRGSSADNRSSRRLRIWRAQDAADNRNPCRPRLKDDSRVLGRDAANPDDRQIRGREPRERPKAFRSERRTGIGLGRRRETGAHAPVIGRQAERALSFVRRADRDPQQKTGRGVRPHRLSRYVAPAERPPARPGGERDIPPIVDQHRNGQRRHERAGQLQNFVDRKSTRLNSSHGYISYAVFCLKKK